MDIFSPPSFEALVSRASPELAAVENMEEFFNDLTGKAGSLLDYEIVQVRVVDTDLVQPGQLMRVASYSADANFDNGAGRIELDLIRRGEELQIVRWFIGGPAITQ